MRLVTVRCIFIHYLFQRTSPSKYNCPHFTGKKTDTLRRLSTWRLLSEGEGSWSEAWAPPLSLKPQCLPGQCQYWLLPHPVTAQLQGPLPARSDSEEDNTACRVQRKESFLATLSTSLPKSGKEEFLLFLTLTSCHVLAALSMLSHLLCLGLLTMPVVFWSCFSLMVVYKPLREDLILNSVKTSGHLGRFVTLAAMKESQRDTHTACLPYSATGWGQESRADMATLKSQQCANEWVYLFVSWHADPFLGLCAWLSPHGFLNSLPTKPTLYVGSMGATGQSVGKQTSGARHFPKPSHLTESLLQELHLACGLPVRSNITNKLLGSRYQCS